MHERTCGVGKVEAEYLKINENKNKYTRIKGIKRQSQRENTNEKYIC